MLHAINANQGAFVIACTGVSALITGALTIICTAISLL